MQSSRSGQPAGRSQTHLHMHQTYAKRQAGDPICEAQGAAQTCHAAPAENLSQGVP